MLSVHTSPLDQPGTGDAGGMNVYVVELSRQLAAAGIEVEIFTRATSRDLPPVSELAPGISVRHVIAGPLEGLTKAELPGQLCTFAREVLRTEATFAPGYYDVIHSHYWLSGQVGALARDRWGVPLVHSMHTMAKVKNGSLAAGDAAEPTARIIGEEQVVDAADLIVANTRQEARQLVELYAAEPGSGLCHHARGEPRHLPAWRQTRRAPAPRHAAGRARGHVRRTDPAAEGAGRGHQGCGRAGGPPARACVTGSSYR